MTIESLNKVSIRSLCYVFNRAFENYFVPLELDKNQLQQKIVSDQIDLSLSAGAFINNELVAFVLHGTGVLKNQKVFYNAGTGVIPEQRGKGVTTIIYKNLLPKLKERNFELGTLEVITNNFPAIKSYEQIGFTIQEELICFRGILQTKSQLSFSKIKKLQPDNINWDYIEQFWDWSPSWQYNTHTIRNHIKEFDCWGYFEDDKILGYVLFDTKSSKIVQFAVDKSRRNEKIASTLFYSLASQYSKKVSLININGNDQATNSFLIKMGFKAFIKQYQMVVRL